MKRILLISPFFYPERISTGFFNTRLAENLLFKGNELDVWCSHPFYPEWKPRFSNSNKFATQIRRSGLNIWYPSNNLFRRIVLETWFSVSTFFNILRGKKEYDLIISVVPPTIFSMVIGLLLDRSKHVIFVHDLQSIHFKSKNNFLKIAIAKIIKKIESLSFKLSSRIVFLSDSMANFIGKNNLKNVVVRVCYGGVTLKRSKNPKKVEFMNSEDINVVYSGALGEKQIPDFLFETFDKASQILKDANFFIISNGPNFERIKERGKNISSNIKFYDLVPQDCLEDLYLKSSIQVIPQKAGTSDGSMPSKLPNLLKMNCPIFSITDKGSDVSHILDEYHLGFHTNTTHSENASRLLARAISDLKEIRATRDDEEIRASTEKILSEKFSMEKLISALIS